MNRDASQGEGTGEGKTKGLIPAWGFLLGTQGKPRFLLGFLKQSQRQGGKVLLVQP